MKFILIELANIFAYRGRSRIDLTGCTSSQNIVVISGANGTGKTSLLNAVKLLFVGAQDPDIRRVGFGRESISAKQFVLGQPGRWYGVFNRLAHEAGDPAHVAMEWQDDGHVFRAEREFSLTGPPPGYVERLTVLRDGVALPEPELALQKILPREVAPFFFFDGEQIQSIADSEIGREQAEIERLLGLSFIVELYRQVEAYGNDKKRAGLPAEARVQLVKVENAVREASAKVDAEQRSRVALEEEIVAQERERRYLDTERNRLRTGISEAERKRAIGRIAALGAQRDKLAGDIADALPPEAPWLTHLDLVKRAFQVLEDQLAGAGDAGMVQRLHADFADTLLLRLGEEMPQLVLDESQRARLRAAVSASLESLGIARGSIANPLLDSLSPKEIERLRDRYLVWSKSGAQVAASHAEQLRLIRQLTHEQFQAQRDLDDAELTSDEARKRFEELSLRISNLDEAIRVNTVKMTEHRIEEERAQRDLAIQSSAVQRQSAELEKVGAHNSAYKFSNKVKLALETYRERRRGLIRSSVEGRLNVRIATLLAPSHLIHSVALDDKFRMTYFDANGQEVARYSISAGMRQLVAMSMLWALKDQAARPMPVIIDTPLGRIDRENRALLMSEYFPAAGNPLILLPTDTEFGEEGYAQLGSRIFRGYRIRNLTSDDAEIVPLPDVKQLTSSIT